MKTGAFHPNRWVWAAAIGWVLMAACGSFSPAIAAGGDDEPPEVRTIQKPRATPAKPAAPAPAPTTDIPQADTGGDEKDTVTTPAPVTTLSPESVTLSTERAEDDPSLSLWPWGNPVQFQTKDGMILRGLYKPPREPRSTVVVFITGGEGDYVEAFRSLVARVAAKGYGVLAFDSRGVARSMKRTDGTTYNLSQHVTESKPYELMIEDTKMVVKWLREKQGILPLRIVLCGSSIGANISIMTAAEMPMDVRSVIAISPGTNFRGLRPLPAAQSLNGRPLFAICAGTDAFSYTLIQQIKRSVPDATALSLGGGAHGYRLLDSELIGKITEWLDKH